MLKNYSFITYLSNRLGSSGYLGEDQIRTTLCQGLHKMDPTSKLESYGKPVNTSLFRSKFSLFLNYFPQLTLSFFPFSFLFSQKIPLSNNNLVLIEHKKKEKGTNFDSGKYIAIVYTNKVLVSHVELICVKRC